MVQEDVKEAQRQHTNGPPALSPVQTVCALPSGPPFATPPPTPAIPTPVGQTALACLATVLLRGSVLQVSGLIIGGNIFHLNHGRWQGGSLRARAL